MKRLLSIVTAAVLVGSVFVGPLPAHAQEVPAVPAEPNVTDPINDANYLNDQGLNSITGRDGDHEGPADASTSADIVAGWFTNDASSVTAHILVEGALPSTPSYFYRMLVDPAGGEDDCLWFQAGIPGIADAGSSPDPIGNLRNLCGDGSIVDGEVALAENPEGGTIISIKIPMGTHGLAIGMTLGVPNVTSRNWPRAQGSSATIPQVDNTKPGIPYTITVGDTAEEEPDEEEEEEPDKDKKAKKNKSKKKKKKKGKPKAPAACPAYAPGELGTDQPMVTVTDAATEESPLEQTVEVAESVADADLLGLVLHAEYAYFNVQVDSDAADAGLYAYIEFPTRRDYDLGFLYPDESYAARARSFNPVVGTPAEIFSAPGHGGEGTDHSEKIVGIRTADCGGYTLEFANWLGEGGEFAIQLWLGEAVNDPQAPGTEPR